MRDRLAVDQSAIAAATAPSHSPQVEDGLTKTFFARESSAFGRIVDALSNGSSSCQRTTLVQISRPVREKNASDRALGWGIIKPAHCPCIRATGQKCKVASERRAIREDSSVSRVPGGALSVNTVARSRDTSMPPQVDQLHVRGSRRRQLPSLVSRLKKIDMFVHNSLHIGRNMRFEPKTVWTAMNGQAW